MMPQAERNKEQLVLLDNQCDPENMSRPDSLKSPGMQ